MFGKEEKEKEEKEGNVCEFFGSSTFENVEAESSSSNRFEFESERSRGRWKRNLLARENCQGREGLFLLGNCAVLWGTGGAVIKEEEEEEEEEEELKEKSFWAWKEEKKKKRRKRWKRIFRIL